MRGSMYLVHEWDLRVHEPVRGEDSVDLADHPCRIEYVLENGLTHDGVKGPVSEGKVVSVADDRRAGSPGDISLDALDVWSAEQGVEAGPGNCAPDDQYASALLVSKERREPLIVLTGPEVLRQRGQDPIDRIDQPTSAPAPAGVRRANTVGDPEGTPPLVDQNRHVGDDRVGETSIFRDQHIILAEEQPSAGRRATQQAEVSDPHPHLPHSFDRKTARDQGRNLREPSISAGIDALRQLANDLCFHGSFGLERATVIVSVHVTGAVSVGAAVGSCDRGRPRRAGNLTHAGLLFCPKRPVVARRT